MSEFKDSWQLRFGAGESSPEEPVDGQTVRLLLAHRTHRAFQDRPIPAAMLTTILGCAFSAPSKSDLQQASAVIVEDPELRGAISDLIPAMPWIRTAPRFLVFLADGYRIERLCEFRDKPFANDNLDNFLAAVSDASLVLQNAIVAAESMGLGCCPISVVRNHMQAIADLLELPTRVVPVAGLCLGYPEREGFVSMRLPPRVTVHTDRYDATDLDADVDAYDRERDARFSIAVDRQKYVEEFGTSDFYGWSEDKVRQMAREERANVGEYVRSNGFTLR